MTTFYKGVAGRRNGNAKGVIIHNDAGSAGATPNFYRNWLPTRQAELGFAHVYMSDTDRYQPEDYENAAWHAANPEGNYWYVGWEVCQSMGDEAQFLRNEQAVFKDVAAYMKSVGMTPNASTVKLHKEFSSTSCPHRSSDLHGSSVEAVRAYYIEQIKKYMGATTSTTTSSTNATATKTVTQTKTTQGRETTMQCIYWKPNKKGDGNDAYYFNGVSSKHLGHPDQINILKKIYKDNNGKDMPEYKWNSNAPWYSRLEASCMEVVAPK